MANRKMHPEDTVIDVKGKKIGGGHFQVIAGPCSIESKEQIVEVANDVKASGAGLLRGGAFKPRTSPYSFQGLQNNGLKLLLEAKAATGLPVVTEIMTPEHLELFDEIDVVQVGARNMQNFQLLKALGKCDKTVLLKRGLANTLEELVMSAEYIMAGGNENVILCERGIRTFETSMRNHSRYFRHSDAAEDDASSDRHRSEPRGGNPLDGGASGSGGCRGGSRRTDDRGSQRSGIGSLRRSSVHDAAGL